MRETKTKIDVLHVGIEINSIQQSVPKEWLNKSTKVSQWIKEKELGSNCVIEMDHYGFPNELNTILFV